MELKRWKCEVEEIELYRYNNVKFVRFIVMLVFE